MLLDHNRPHDLSRVALNLIFFRTFYGLDIRVIIQLEPVLLKLIEIGSFHGGGLDAWLLVDHGLLVLRRPSALQVESKVVARLVSHLSSLSFFRRILLILFKM